MTSATSDPGGMPDVPSGGLRALGGATAGAVSLAWRASPGGFAWIVSLAVVAALFPPATIVMARRLVDLVIATHHRPPTSAVALTVAAMGTILGAQRAIGSLEANQQSMFSDRVRVSAEASFAGHAARSDMASIDDPSWHDRMARASREVSWRSANIAYQLVGLIGSVVALAGMLAVLASIHPLLAILSVTSVMPGLLMQGSTNRRLYSYWFESTPRWRLREYLHDLLTGPQWTKEVRAFGLRDELLGRYVAISREQLDGSERLYRRSNALAATGGLLGGVILAGAYGFMAVRGLEGRLTAGDLTAAIGAIASIAGLIGAVSGSLLALDQHANFLRDFFWFLKQEPRLVGPVEPRPVPTSLHKGITFENVVFRYPLAVHPALDGLNLHIHAGEMLALVGENGAGKTSLVKLLLRFYESAEGKIMFDGEDIAHCDPAHVREQIGVIFQDFGSYSLTLRENVSLGRPGAGGGDGQLIAALRSARAERILERLPSGLDSNVGRLFEGGIDLSGGEWQRVALARMIYRNAGVWILDEPTAALDPEAEAAVFQELRGLLKSRIGIIISHRFSTVRMADRIAVLDAGRVAELGTHDELIALGGKYAHLYDLQAAAYK
ncbi:MAG: ABC transporter ATP-binding protein [Candidatus Dormibacteria bacterium]